MNLLTHSDMDGNGSAILLKYLFPNQLKHIWSVSYKNLESVINDIKKYKDQKLIVTDISFTQKEIDMLNDFECVTLFDHHDTSLNLDINFKNIIDTTRCGTKILFDYLIENGYSFPIRYEKLVDLIQDYDCWILSDPNSILLNEIFYKYQFLEFIDLFIDDKIPKTDWKWAKEKRKLVEEKVKNFVTETYKQYRITLCSEYNCVNDISIIYNQEDVNFIITSGSKISLRSKKDMKNIYSEFKHDELKSIGGHAHAGGINFNSDIDMMEAIEQLIEIMEN